MEEKRSFLWRPLAKFAVLSNLRRWRKKISRLKNDGSEADGVAGAPLPSPR